MYKKLFQTAFVKYTMKRTEQLRKLFSYYRKEETAVTKQIQCAQAV